MTVRTSRSPRRFFWLGLLWLATLALLAWALHEVRTADLREILSRLGAWQALLLILLDIGVFALISARWRLLLGAQGYPVPFSRILVYRLVAHGINYFTPGPQVGGEPAQVYFLQKKHGVPAPQAIASVSLDKILELLANAVFLLVGLYAALREGLFVKSFPLEALSPVGAMLALLLVYSAALWAGRTPLAWLFGRLAERFHSLERIGQVAASAEQQISRSCRQQPRIILQASLLSSVAWVAMLLEYWLAARFLGLELNPGQAIAAITAASVAFMSPIPGALGVLEAGQVFVMQALGVNPVFGISISLWIRMRDIALGGSGLLLGSIFSQGKLGLGRDLKLEVKSLDSEGV
ncbi:MAG TPA: lysylphosphatidylglycerol synthase transmembrane domain-containing protein [Anaerolineales bacterium]